MHPPLRPAAIVAVLLVATVGCSDDDVGGSAVIVTTTAESVTDETSSTTADTTASTPADASESAETTDGRSSSTTSTTTTITPTTTTIPAGPRNPLVAFRTVAMIDSPVDLAWRESSPELFIVSQDGTIEMFDPAAGDEVTVLDITDLTSASGERGLLGLAMGTIDGSDRAYVDYNNGSGDTIIAEYSVLADGTFDAASRRVLMEIDQPYGNHNGGDLAIGPDGMLYIGMGDGGSADDPERRATDLTSLLGKLLRIDPRPSGDSPYGVPADNPFVGAGDGVRGEIWSFGLRNPWKFTFDPATDDLWIADVGQNEFEEVNVVPADAGGITPGRGLSFGWSAFEGTERFNDDVDADGHTAPVLTYDHSDGCSISGGAPYRGAAIPDLVGMYVFSDYCSGTIWALDLPTQRTLVLDSRAGVTSIVAGPDQELYILSPDGTVVTMTAADG